MTNPSFSTHYVSLNTHNDNGEFSAPPEKVLQVCVVGDLTVLSVCKYEDTHSSSTTTTESEVTVDTASLLSALISQLDGDVGDMAFIRHDPRIARPKS